MTKRRTAERAVIDAAMQWRDAWKAVQERPEANHFGLGANASEKLRNAVDAVRALDLEPATAVRTTSLPRATSEAAAAYMSKSVHRVVGEVFREIMSVYRQNAIGLTTDAIEQRLKRSHQSVSPRVTDLRDQGWIADSGSTRKTRSGQDAVVWTPTYAAIHAAAQVPEWSW